MKKYKRSIILDTDIGYDPDDLFALIFLHRLAKEDLRLVTTSNEQSGIRAAFTKKVLKVMGNKHTKVMPGIDTGSPKFIMNDLVGKNDYSFDKGDFLQEMKNIVLESEETIYIGIGGFTNLAHFIDSYEETARKMKIFLMGGAIGYSRGPNWVEYNIRMDIQSAKRVVESGFDITMVMAQTTNNPKLEINSDNPFYAYLGISQNSILYLLYEHCRRWFTIKTHGTNMHDPLTVATALGYDFVTIRESLVSMGLSGEIHLSEFGSQIKWTTTDSKAGKFMHFMAETIKTIG